MQLARKLTLPLGLAAFLALGISAWLSVRDAIALHHADLAHDQAFTGNVLLGVLEREKALGLDEQRLTQLLADTQRSTSRMQLQLVSLNEVTLSAEQQLALQHGETVFELNVWHTAQTWIPTDLPGGKPGVLWIHESLDAERGIVQRIVVSHILNVAVLCLCWAIVALGVGAVVVGRPMRALADKARRIGQGDYSTPLTIRQHDEIGRLAIEMNHMCNELLSARERIQHEVDARASAQHALRHADRLTTVGLLAAGIAHELGTPLNVVSLCARMISTGEVSGDDVKAKAEIVSQQASHMTRIIRQLLDFARRRQPIMTLFSLSEVLKSTLNMLQPLAEKQRCHVLLAEEVKSVEVEGDPNQLQQVIANLIINSIQAMPHGGPITVTLKTVKATPPADVGGPESNYAQLDVSDQGEGIAAEVLPRIFEPFFTTKEVGDGNGLGLPVAWGIVRDHRGWIAVASAPKIKTTFSLFLPLP